MRRGKATSERGAAAVETAFLVTFVLVPLVIGAVEFGFGFNEWLSVTAATREGVRAGASAGPLEAINPGDKDADCLALEAAAGALTSVDGDAVAEIWIFKADAGGNPTAWNRYRPKIDTDLPGSLFCNNWVRIGPIGWPIASRDNSGANRDNIGLRVVFDHAWVTGLPPFSGSVQWRSDTIMRIEPEADL